MIFTPLLDDVPSLSYPTKIEIFSLTNSTCLPLFFPSSSSPSLLSSRMDRLPSSALELRLMRSLARCWARRLRLCEKSMLTVSGKIPSHPSHPIQFQPNYDPILSSSRRNSPKKGKGRGLRACFWRARARRFSRHWATTPQPRPDSTYLDLTLLTRGAEPVDRHPRHLHHLHHVLYCTLRYPAGGTVMLEQTGLWSELGPAANSSHHSGHGRGSTALVQCPTIATLIPYWRKGSLKRNHPQVHAGWQASQ